MRYLSTVVLFLMLSTSGFSGELADLYKQTYKNQNRKAAIQHSRDYKEVISNETEISEIGIERTLCFGTCPAYSFIVKKDGSFSYEGTDFVERKGKYTGKVDLWTLNNVFKTIKDFGYMGFENEYYYTVTDNPTVYTTVVKNGQRKIIKNYANTGPIKLWVIEQLIDSLMGNAKWDKRAH